MATFGMKRISSDKKMTEEKHETENRRNSFFPNLLE